MKTIGLLVWLLASITWGLNAQTQSRIFSVKGVVVDSLTQATEPYVTIRIFAAADAKNPVHLAVTDQEGKFKEALKGPGEYTVVFTSVGKGAVSRAFRLSEAQPVKDLGVIAMAESAEMLEGVEIVAQKPLVKAEIDKLTYSIEDDPDSKTNSVLEMLRKVPLVTIDGEENIEVNGSKSFKVHVNGRPNNLMSNNPKEVLKGLPAHSIKSIEVITDPGTKYDAEGIGGILNIITLKDNRMEGYNVTVNGGLNNNAVVSGVYATVQLGKFTLSGNYTYTHIDTPLGHVESGREDYTSDEYKYLNSSSSTKNKSGMQFGSVEGSYEIDSLNLISFSMDLMGMDNKGRGDGSTRMLNALHQPAYSYRTLTREKSDFYGIGANLDYQHAFRKKGEYLTLSYRYNATPQDSESYTEYEEVKDYPYDMDFLRNQYFNNDARTDEHTFQVDYTNPVAKGHDLAVGAKYILRDNTSDVEYFKEYDGVYRPDKGLSDNFEQSQHILAAYTEYKLSWKQWAARAGVRYEHTFMDVEYAEMAEKNYNTDFDDLVPNLTLSYQLAPTQTLRASYNMRISRPSIWFLNPFQNTSDPTHITSGNPDLDTEKSHRLGLTYSSFGANISMNASLNYSFVDNGIEQYSFINQGVMQTTYGNVGKTKRTRLSLWMNWNPGSKTRISINGSGDYVDYRCEEAFLNQRNSGFSGSLSLNIQQQLPWDLRLSLNGYGSTPRISLQGKGFSMYSYGMGLSRAFLKGKRLNVSLNASSLFHEYMTLEDKTYASTFYSWSRNKVPQRTYGFSISWRFGELKARVKKAERTINNDDVKQGGGGAAAGGGMR